MEKVIPLELALARIEKSAASDEEKVNQLEELKKIKYYDYAIDLIDRKIRVYQHQVLRVSEAGVPEILKNHQEYDHQEIIDFLLDNEFHYDFKDVFEQILNNDDREIVKVNVLHVANLSDIEIRFHYKKGDIYSLDILNLIEQPAYHFAVESVKLISDSETEQKQKLRRIYFYNSEFLSLDVFVHDGAKDNLYDLFRGFVTIHRRLVLNDDGEIY